MQNNRSRGFTLIELLVVIAIIGILSAVVLASLNTARSKGNDAAVKSNLDTIRTQSAIYYDGTGNNSYGTLATASSQSNCTSFTANTLLSDANVKAAIMAADNANGSSNITCNMNSNGTVVTAWVIASPLVSNTSQVFCVDSTGAATTTTAVPSSGAYSC